MSGQIPPRLTTKTVIWKDRLVKMLDTLNWAMSRAGDHNDWDYYPATPGPGMPVAGSMGVMSKFEYEPATPAAKVFDLDVTDDDRLLFVTDDGFWAVTGDPADGGRIDRLECDPRIVEPSHIVNQ